MLIFSKAKLVFLSMPKTGTTAYETALSPFASQYVCDPPELKHAPVYRYNRFFRPMLEKFVSPDIETLAVVREPIDWLGSWYRYRHRPFLAGKPTSTAGMSFDAFVQAYCKGSRPAFANVGSQVNFVKPQPNGTKVDHLFRYENQSGLLTFLEERLGIKIELARENVSPAMPLSLSPEVEEKLRRKCAEEFELWESIT
ncbi:gamma-glutamyl kinase [Litorivita pollutaquae]|uniref:Gamma-glutamyl kinase n=1 Tax=Litorivita pollutaquae TaxID=2200892 RepID=A0A2V4NDQ7_9RHOB|nr:gamma-glutamyl kinase [Litorivita pollutaquae]PYC48393.1 gamma-glutamyl kinase [Litorivita pollutaquae]